MNRFFSSGYFLFVTFLVLSAFPFTPNLSAFSDSLVVTIDLSSTDSVVVQGDTLDFDIALTNHTAGTLEVDLWFTILPDSGSEALIPASLLCVPNNPKALSLRPNQSGTRPCWLRIPPGQNPGSYTMFGMVGDYVNTDSLIIDEDFLRFQVVEAVPLHINHLSKSK